MCGCDGGRVSCVTVSGIGAGALKKAEDSPWGEITGPEPEITEVAGISCDDPGRRAGSLVRGLMPVTGALEPDCSGSRSRIVSSTREEILAGKYRFICVELLK